MNRLGAIQSENEDEKEEVKEVVKEEEEILVDDEFQEPVENNLSLEIEKPPVVTIAQVKPKSKIHSLKAKRFVESEYVIYSRCYTRLNLIS